MYYIEMDEDRLVVNFNDINEAMNVEPEPDTNIICFPFKWMGCNVFVS